MRNTKRWIIIAAAAALGAGLLRAQAPGRFGAGHQKRMEFVAGYLGLTEDQKAQAKDTFEKARIAAEPVVTELKAAREALEKAVKAGDNAQMQALSARVGALTGQLVATYTQAVSTFYASLTPDQQAKADKLHDAVRPRLGALAP